MSKIEANYIYNDSSIISQVINNTINGTSLSTSTPVLKQIHDILIVVLLVWVMFAMGCSVTLKQVLNHLIRPIALIVGLISQFVLMPLCAYCIILFLDMDALYATGLLILACSPGGVLSNIFTYFWNGDIPLSITMTTVATIVALVMMPFNIWLYGRNLETESVVIPYRQMSFTLILITIPVLIGMLMNYKFPKLSPYITKVGVVAGFSIIIVCQTLEIFIFPDIFNDVPLSLYIADSVLPIMGLAIGYITSSAVCLDSTISKTIAVEIGVKNVGTAITIVMLSFPFEQLRKTILFPFLYTFSSWAVLIIVTIYLKIYHQFCAEPSDLVRDKGRSSIFKRLLKQESTTPLDIEDMENTDAIVKTGINTVISRVSGNGCLHDPN